MNPALALFALTGLIACGDGSDSGGGDDELVIDESTELATDGGSYFISYTSDPSPIPENDYFTLTVSVYDNTDQTTLVADAGVTIDATMPQHGHGMTTQPIVTGYGDGTFLVEGMLFHMGGYWQIIVDVDGPMGAETATFELDCCE